MQFTTTLIAFAIGATSFVNAVPTKRLTIEPFNLVLFSGTGLSGTPTAYDISTTDGVCKNTSDESAESALLRDLVKCTFFTEPNCAGFSSTFVSKVGFEISTEDIPAGLAGTLSSFNCKTTL
ncbi:hypothetical protein DL96DRAFT_1628970 [Flagelloscypha sp. PMI_526]|nr:hypothetical protein DL96DRAFT_1628970 [Flagelloscypha sp. PMI_526]